MKLRRCPDCNGMGEIWTMHPDPDCSESVLECSRCDEFQGMIPVEDE